jgi:hypothetical protein
MSVPKTEETGVSFGSTELLVTVGAVTTMVDIVPVTGALALGVEVPEVVVEVVSVPVEAAAPAGAVPVDAGVAGAAGAALVD